MWLCGHNVSPPPKETIGSLQQISIWTWKWGDEGKEVKKLFRKKIFKEKRADAWEVWVGSEFTGKGGSKSTSPSNPTRTGQSSKEKFPGQLRADVHVLCSHESDHLELVLTFCLITQTVEVNDHLRSSTYYPIFTSHCYKVPQLRKGAESFIHGRDSVSAMCQLL